MRSGVTELVFYLRVSSGVTQSDHVPMACRLRPRTDLELGAGLPWSAMAGVVVARSRACSLTMTSTTWLCLISPCCVWTVTGQASLPLNGHDHESDHCRSWTPLSRPGGGLAAAAPASAGSIGDFLSPAFATNWTKHHTGARPSGATTQGTGAANGNHAVLPLGSALNQCAAPTSIHAPPPSLSSGSPPASPSGAPTHRAATGFFPWGQRFPWCGSRSRPWRPPSGTHHGAGSCPGSLGTGGIAPRWRAPCSLSPTTCRVEPVSEPLPGPAGRALSSGTAEQAVGRAPVHAANSVRSMV